MSQEVVVIGGGLAGCEAAFQLAKRNIKVLLYEMKPNKKSPAHIMDSFAELVCSNSLRANNIENAVGLLKEEMRLFDSLIMDCADSTAIPAGGALAVDRDKFSQLVTEKIYSNPNIRIINEEITSIPIDSYVIVASGPLTSACLSDSISQYTGSNYLYFYDAAAPIITYESIDKDKIFFGSRYDKGDDDYINCPMSEEQYNVFYNELIKAEVVPLKVFEKEIVFEGCMPVETMAKRGYNTLLFGPLKPVGLNNPKSEEKPFAVVQLRQDNTEGTLYNIVGFQTHLKWGEQKRVFSLIPGLENAEFARYGVMHRNTYINSPKLLLNTLQMKNNPKVMFAGQITGVEGYVESASSGLVAGINMSRIVLGNKPYEFPKTTAHGSLCNYITDDTNKNFQPMNINYGLFPKLEIKTRSKSERSKLHSTRALNDLQQFINCM